MYKMYSDFAEWWPLLSAVEDYREEADYFLKILPPSTQQRTLLELGCGGGNLASHLAGSFALTLTDLSPQMLAVSRRLNPRAEHLCGDMRTLRLNRQFDVVLMHDAVVYCASEGDLREALQTAALHCKPNGLVLIAPDAVKESFVPATDCGGEDGADGRSLRYLEWSRLGTDLSTCEVSYTVVRRFPDGFLATDTEVHLEGLFSTQEWRAWSREAGIDVDVQIDPWGRTIFLGVRRPQTA